MSLYIVKNKINDNEKLPLNCIINILSSVSCSLAYAALDSLSVHNMDYFRDIVTNSYILNYNAIFDKDYDGYYLYNDILISYNKCDINGKVIYNRLEQLDLFSGVGVQQYEGGTNNIKCTCGISSVYGKTCDLSYHSDYCDLRS
jgi:hypothetical protein